VSSLPASSDSLLELTVLGSGTSMGVPTLTCHCAVCSSKDPRDKRLRPSVLLVHRGQTAVIDTTPDFRFQAMRVGLERLMPFSLLMDMPTTSWVSMTYDRITCGKNQHFPFMHRWKPWRLLNERSRMCFDGLPAVSTVPRVTLHPIEGPFDVIGTRIVPVPALHGTIGVLGFRFGSAAYLTDFSVIPDSSKALLSGLDDLVLDALRDSRTRCTRPSSRLWLSYANYSPAARGLRTSPTNCRIRKRMLA